MPYPGTDPRLGRLQAGALVPEATLSMMRCSPGSSITRVSPRAAMRAPMAGGSELPLPKSTATWSQWMGPLSTLIWMALYTLLAAVTMLRSWSAAPSTLASPGYSHRCAEAEEARPGARAAASQEVREFRIMRDPR
jgi:hypothetical protein